MTDLYVNEVFGPTFQGEGPHMGRNVAFLRLAGCNLHCVWCDTPYTWDYTRFDKGAETRRRSVASVYTELASLQYMNVQGLVVSGGEPMLQQDALEGLLRLIRVPIEIETNGTILPRGQLWKYVAQFNVSPKLSHAAAGPTAWDPFAWMAYPQAIFKFVVQSVEDLDEVSAFNLPPEKVWIMPEGTDCQTILERQRLLAQSVLERGWNFTTRLQVLLWNAERAR